MLTTHSHIFENWDQIPNVSHLLEIKNNYVDVFEGHKCEEATTYVCYVVKYDNLQNTSEVVAFGSATYFDGYHYYVDFDNENYTPEQQSLWKLWIEGLVSIEKGCGSVVLLELEKWLSHMSEKYAVERKVINIISVNESVGFYEENGYVACYTGPRFAGTDNTRVAKVIPNSGFDISLDICPRSIDIYPSDENDVECLEWDIAGYIIQGRRIPLLPYIEIPKDIPRTEYKNYVHNNTFKDYITDSMRKNIFDHIDEMNS